MTKKEARQQIKDKIKQLDKQYIKEADQAIFEQIKDLKEYKEAETIDRTCTETGKDSRCSIMYRKRDHGNKTDSNTG